MVLLMSALERGPGAHSTSQCRSVLGCAAAVRTHCLQGIAAEPKQVYSWAWEAQGRWRSLQVALPCKQMMHTYTHLPNPHPALRFSDFACPAGPLQAVLPARPASDGVPGAGRRRDSRSGEPRAVRLAGVLAGPG